MFGLNNKTISASYKKLFIATCLFWLFEFLYLVPNIIISHQLKEAALKINISGRQRALSQKMAKDILQIKLYPNELQYKEQLIIDFELFDATYLALKKGGETKDSRGNFIYVNKAGDHQILNTLSAMDEVWNPYKKLIKNFIDGSNNSKEKVDIAVDFSNYASNILLNQMNKVTALEEEKAEEKANLIQFIQLCAIIASLVNTLYLTKNVIDLLSNTSISIKEEVSKINNKITK